MPSWLVKLSLKYLPLGILRCNSLGPTFAKVESHNFTTLRSIGKHETFSQWNFAQLIASLWCHKGTITFCCWHQRKCMRRALFINTSTTAHNSAVGIRIVLSCRCQIEFLFMMKPSFWTTGFERSDFESISLTNQREKISLSDFKYLLLKQGLGLIDC